MARKPRIHVTGGFYHVIMRGNARQDIFADHDDRRIWQSIEKRALADYGYRLHVFCWMTNHVHKLITGTSFSATRPATSGSGADPARSVAPAGGAIT